MASSTDTVSVEEQAELMTFRPLWEILGEQQPDPTDPRHLWIFMDCRGGTMDCVPFPLDSLELPTDTDPLYRKELNAAIKVLQNTWKTTLRHLRQAAKKETGQDVDVGLIPTKTGWKIGYSLTDSHGKSAAHKSGVHRGRVKETIKVDTVRHRTGKAKRAN